jgi:hypothetical protein
MALDFSLLNIILQAAKDKENTFGERGVNGSLMKDALSPIIEVYDDENK